MRDHRSLRVFRLADALALRIYSATGSFPREERFGLSAQLRRAAVSVGANIAEGCARGSDAEFIRFLMIAYGSARELEFELSLAKRLGYLPDKPARELDDLTEQTCRALHRLIDCIRPWSREHHVR